MEPKNDSKRPSTHSSPPASIGLCRALFAYKGEKEGDLSFSAGEIIHIIQKNPKWWAGVTQEGRVGVFPRDTVQEIDQLAAATSSSSSTEPERSPTPITKKKDLKARLGFGRNSASSPSGLVIARVPGSSASPPVVTRSMGSSLKQEPADDLGARPLSLQASSAEGSTQTDAAASFADRRKSYRVEQLLDWKEESTHLESVRPQSGFLFAPSARRKKYFDELIKLQSMRDNYVQSVFPLLEAKNREFSQLTEDYLKKLRVSAQRSGISPERVERLVDAERVRLNLSTWSLFLPEALDMHALEEDVGERAQVLETEQSIILAQSFVRRWLVRRRYGPELMLRHKRLWQAMEIVKTERTYVRSLQTIVQNFMEPLQKSGLIRNDEKSKLFSNVNLIVGVNQTLLHQLEERVSDWSFETCLGDVFLTLSPYLIMYTTYISNYTQAMETYQRLQQQPAFANMITKCKATLDAKLSFEDYQIMPVQRIPRYVLLVEGLLKYTPESHPDRALLTDALALLRDVAKKINEQRRLNEAMQKVMEIQQSIIGFSEELVQPSRRLVHEGEVTRFENGHTASSNCFLFLFNDILVVTERKKSMFDGKNYYTFKEQVSMQNMSGGELEGNPTGFVLRTKYGIVDSFLADNQRKRDEWVNCLNSVSEDLRKNLASLKLTGSSSETIDTRSEKTDQNALIASLSSLSVPNVLRSPPSSSGSASPSTQQISMPPSSGPTPPSTQQTSMPPLAASTSLGEVVNVLHEVLNLEHDLFQPPIEIQSIMPRYCQSIHPQTLMMLGDRLRLLSAKLNEIYFAQQKVKALLLKDAPIRGVHNLDSLVKEGRNPIGNLKEWVQQSFPSNAVSRPLSSEQPRTLMAALLKWYLSLSESWTAILSSVP